ncbi:MAG TPA: glycosyltransferase family 2 protein [Sedimentisphaerales bacterium]|nr:glycosyltransferase family 2 protein [Sedimentisphaerales bacterium]
MKKKNNTFKNSHPRILTAIPVFNEYQYVSHVVSAVRQFTDNILVIDDGSTDGSEIWISNCPFIRKVIHPGNQGYGQSIIDAIDYAQKNNFNWLITLDCDYQHQPEYISSFYDEIKKGNCDLISGSRYLTTENKGRFAPPADRLTINKRITALLNCWFNLNITDAFCGFKAYKLTSLSKLNLTEKGYAMPLQLWIQAAGEKLRITEIKVPLIYHDTKRNFAGELENPVCRMNYYMQTIIKELFNYENKNTPAIRNTI